MGPSTTSRAEHGEEEGAHMNRWSSFPVAALLAIAATGATAAEQQRVVVRTYDTTGLSAEDFERAATTVREIFEQADVALQWRNCPPTQTAAATDTCSDALGPDDIILRLAARPTPGRRVPDRSALGSILHTGTRRGTLMTVFVDRVHATAREAAVDRNVLLGRVIAHEIGHLLLGTAHAREGLMRARWTLDSLRRDVPGDWRFSTREAFEMHKVMIAGIPASHGRH
jgi:hypothetical protein